MSTRRYTKFVNHAEGIGTVSLEMVEQRAREIALSDGRKPEAYSEGDWNQAKKELTRDYPDAEAPADDPDATVTASDDVVVTPSKHKENIPSSPDRGMAEILVEQGLDEADHDQRVESEQNRKRS